jgi:hypothetical protein
LKTATADLKKEDWEAMTILPLAMRVKAHAALQRVEERLVGGGWRKSRGTGLPCPQQWLGHK